MTLRRTVSRSEYFIDCLEAAVERINVTAPELLGNIDIAMEDVPSGLKPHEDRVPLASAIEPTAVRRARIVLFRRPLEHRSSSRRELRLLVHRTLVEQVAALTGRSVGDIDPMVDDDD